jgi:hypothetical protein
MLETSNCSALEDLVAFAEGRLHGAERERVIAHLAECADCREVLAGIVETAEELDREDNPGVTVPMTPKRPRFGWPARAAAAAALGTVAMGAVVLWQLDARQHPPSPTEWLAEMTPNANQLAPHTWEGIRLRGEEETSELYAQSTELGALLVDIRVTAEARDRDKTIDYLRRMAAILDAAGYMENDPSTLRTIAQEPDIERMRTAVIEKLPNLEKRLRERFEPSFLDFGTFIEEAQVAASFGDRTFLASRDARRYLDWVLSRPELALPVENAEPKPLPENVGTALTALKRTGTDDATRAAAAKEILDTLGRWAG